MSEDYNKIAKIEKAIEKKYGPESIENPKKHWNQEKEKEFLKQRKNFYGKVYKKKENSILEKEEYKISSKFEADSKDRHCPVCQDYLYSNHEFAYIIKYDCCKNCYIKHVEFREERWNSGWRPEQ